MAVGEIKTFTINQGGIELTVAAKDIGGGQSEFTITCLQGSTDINALYWHDGIDDGNDFSLGDKKDNSLNMNGSKEDWDGGIKLSATGLGSAGTDKETYLTAGESHGPFTANVSFDDLDTIGIRATGSGLKSVASDPVLTPLDHFPNSGDLGSVTFYFGTTEGDVRGGHSDDDTGDMGGGGMGGGGMGGGGMGGGGMGGGGMGGGGMGGGGMGGGGMGGGGMGGGGMGDMGPTEVPDGVYTVRVDGFGANSGDFDDYFKAILAKIIEQDPNVDESTALLGVSIQAGGSEHFYEIDNDPNDVDVIPDPPGALVPDDGIDATWSFSALMGL
jgi:hypothetical protein